MRYEIIYSQKGKDLLTSTKHYHDNTVEIIQIKSGCGNLLINDKIFKFQTGDVFMFDASSLHCTSPDNPEKYCRNKLIFEKQAVTSLIGKSKFNIHFNAGDDVSAELDRLFLNIKNLSEQDDCEILTISEILKLLHICHKNKSNIEPITGVMATKVIEMISDDISSCNNLDKISKKLHISKYHMCRKFKEETGITIYTYIKAQKIALAKKLLCESDKPVSDIAYEIGFADTPCFTRAFKHETGMSPSQFRKSSE